MTLLLPPALGSSVKSGFTWFSVSPSIRFTGGTSKADMGRTDSISVLHHGTKTGGMKLGFKDILKAKKS